MPTRHTLVALPLLAIAIGLTGCVQSPDAAPGAPTSTVPSASATPSPTPKPTATSTPDPTAVPVTIGCDELITPDEFYSYNPNFSLLTEFTPEAGTAAADALASQGIACRWVNQTSTETLDISVANLTEPSLSERKAAAASTGFAVTTYGPDGYFDNSGAAGVAQLFSGAYWITISSTVIGQPVDAQALMADAVAALP